MITNSALYRLSQLAAAAYANLRPGATGDLNNREALQDPTGSVGMVQSQLDKFVEDASTVVMPFDDLAIGRSSFSAVLFKDSAPNVVGNITLAIKGTNELTGVPSDLSTDADIAFAGAGFDQIVAMSNWWRQVATPRGQMVAQHELVEISHSEWTPQDVIIRTGESLLVLRDALPAQATGEIADALVFDPDGKVDVTGHSLGGHLAMAFSTIFQSQAGEVTVFNAPGFKDNATVRAFFAKLGGSIPTGERITNVIADEAFVGDPPFNAIAGRNSRPGEPVNIAIENQWQSDETAPFTARNHSITAIVDTLAVYKLLADLDVDGLLDEDDYKRILNQAAQGAAGSLERLVDSLEQLLGVDDRPLEIGNGKREDLYAAIYSLVNSAQYQSTSGAVSVTVSPSAGSEILARASGVESGAIAYRYALDRLSPLLILGNDGLYSIHNAKGELNLYDPGSRTGSLTTRWLEDRSQFFERSLYINRLDLDKDYQDKQKSDPNTFPNAPDPTGAAYQLEGRHYEDIETGYIASTGGSLDSLEQFKFGGGRSDYIRGGGRDDRLYGGGGSDVLAGAYGADYLEGGLGTDVYEFGGRDGFFGTVSDGDDTILDIDGKGVLRYTYTEGVFSRSTSTKIAGGVVFALPEGGWQSADGKFSYTLQGGDMIVAINGDAGGTLTLKDFREGDFGIRLHQSRTKPQNFIREFIGDKEDWDSKDDTGLQTEPDGLGNTRRADGQEDRPDVPQIDREDIFFGAADASAERFQTAGGNDVVYADGELGRLSEVGGDDYIDTGAGRDVVEAGVGNDWIEGGAGADILGGNAGDDTIYAEGSNTGTLTVAAAIMAGDTAEAVSGLGEILSGDAGNDVLIASNRSDLLFGGSDTDIIIGGAGDDTIFSDGSLTFAAFEWEISRRILSGPVTTFLVQSDTVVCAAPGTVGDADVIYGGNGDDWIFAGGGDDYIEAGLGRDVVFGEAGSDILIGGAGDDFLNGDSATVSAAGLGGDDFLDGGDGKDILQGEAGSDVLYGGAGDDELYGGEGDDLLYGGPGDDILVGGPGKDTYVFNRGDGVEVIQDTAANANDPEASVVVLGEGISRSDVKFRKGSLLVDLGPSDPNDPLAGTDAIHFLNFDADFPELTAALGELRFADGSIMTYGDVLAQGFDIDGTEFDDVEGDALIGTSVTDRIRGFAGNDELEGRGGADVLEGGADDDALDGGAGDDLLLGGEGDDELRGGEGNDDLFGDAGNDTYVFNIGDGDDAIDDLDGTSTLRFASGIDPAAVSVSRYTGDAGDDWIRIGYGSNDSVSVKAGADAIIAFDNGYEIKLSGLLGGLTLTGTTQSEVIYGTDGNDTIDGKGGGDEVYGGLGDDVLSGGTYVFADSLYGEEGDDTFRVGRQAANVFGGEGSDSYVLPAVIHGQVQIHDDSGRIVISDESVFASLNIEDFGDVVYVEAPHFSVTLQDDGNQVDLASWSIESPDGTSFNLAEYAASRPTGMEWQVSNYRRQIMGAFLERQSVVALAGIDVVTGASGSSQYSGASVSDFVIGDVRYVTHQSYSYSSQVLVDVQESDAPTIVAIGDDLITTVTESETTSTVDISTPRPSSSDFSRQTQQAVWVPISRPLPPVNGYMRAVSSISYADAYPSLRGYWVYPETPAGAMLESLPVSARMQFTHQSRSVASTLTVQEVYGGPSNNQIVTAGYSIVDAGAGDDVVTVTDVSALSLSADMAYTVTLEGDAEPQVTYGVSANVYGSLLYGNAGDDSLTGAGGDDALIGGTGADILDGRGGGDRYVLFEGDGIDVIADTGDDLAAYVDAYRRQNEEGSVPPVIAGNDYDAIEALIDTYDEDIQGFLVQSDIVELPINLYSDTGYADDVEFFADDQYLHIRSGAGVGVDIRLAQEWDPVGTGVEYLWFMDEDLFIRDAIALASSEEEGVETSGTAEADVLLGGWGADLIQGYDGDDELYGRNGNDTLEGGAGDDYLDGGAGNDLLHGQAGRDILRGHAGSDELIESGPDHNFIDGGVGEDYVYVEGASLVIGGAGDDEIDIFGDAAVVSYNIGDGRETIHVAGEMTLSLGGLIAEGDMGLGIQGHDVILFLTSDDTIRLTRAAPEGDWPTITLQRIDGSGVRRYDFNAVIEERYVQLATNRDSEFVLADVLARHLLQTSEDEAIGGEIAYRYAMHGQVDDLSVSDIHAVIDDEEFGFQAQKVETIGSAVVQGTAGDDVLTGTAAGDVIAGGPGNDVLDGGLGDDSYVFNVGDGEDHILDAGGFDTVTFGPGITEGDISLGLGSLLLRIGEHDAIHIDDFNPADALNGHAIEAFRFSDGTEILYEDLLQRGFDLSGTPGDDVIGGTSVSDRIEGGSGDDVLDGGAGDDVYAFDAGDGADTIVDGSGEDRIEFGPGITPNAVAVSRSVDGITLTVRGTGDSVMISSSSSDQPRIAAVDFADGSSWSSTELVDRINDAPFVVADPGETVVVEDEPFEVQVPEGTFSDPDTWGTLTYRATMSDGSSLADWLAFDAHTLTFSGTPGNSNVGSHAIMITAVDQDGLSASASLTITVENVNDSPETVAPIADRVGREDELVAFSIAPPPFTDIDNGDVLSYSASLDDGNALPAWLSFDAAALRFAGVPGNDDVGRYALRITATDTAGATASGGFNLTVENVNDAPVVHTSLPDRLAYQSATLDFILPADAFVDIDAGDTLTLTARSADGSGLPAWLSFDAESARFTGTPDPAQAGSYAISVTATDREGAAATAAFDLIVSDAGSYSAVYRGTKRDDTVTTGPGNDLIEAGKGDDIVSSNAGRDVVFGGKGDDRLTLGYGNDIGFGGDGKDVIDGGPGHDLLVGDDGGDRLYGGAGNDVLLGGAGKDELYAGGGNNLLIGGPGGDALYGGQAYDVFAFDRRDGKAAIYGGDGSLSSNRDTLSFGSGIAARDIVLRRSGKDLVLKIDDDRDEREDGNVSVTLKDWYGSGNHRTVNRLQIVGDRTETYDFTALVARFDASTRGKSTPWRAASVMSSVLVSSASQEAIGGVLAEQYAKSGSIASVAVAAFESTVGDDAFARDAQSVANGSGATLAAYFAKDGDDEQDWGWPGLPDFGHSRHGDDGHDHPGRDERDRHEREARPGSTGGVKPLDLQAILAAMERFVHDANGNQVERRAASVPAQATGGVSSWAMTNALVQFHLTSPRDVMLGAGNDCTYGHAPAAPAVSIPAAQAALGVPGFGRDAQSLRSFDGLREGLARLA